MVPATPSDPIALDPPATAGAEAFDVELAGATLHYGRGALFEGLDFVLHGGAWTCLLGPSGVGKSSLLRVIAGLERLAAGRVRATDGRPLASRIAWMGQQDLLLPWLSVQDNVVLGARLRGESPDRARADALLAAVGMTRQRDQWPATLSGGQRQRAALARTLMEERPVVLMDEPFSALDAITRTRLQALAARLLAGRTVLLVTHDPLEALRLGHRIQVMLGHPARIEAPIRPEGEPPRGLHDTRLLALQGDLLDRLTDAQDQVA